MYLKVFIKGIGFHVKIGLAPTLETEYVVCFGFVKKTERRAEGGGRGRLIVYQSTC